MVDKRIIFALSAAAVFSYTAYAQTSLDERISYKHNQNGFTVGVKEPFEAHDRISVTVLQTGKSFDDIKTSSDINSANVIDIKTFVGSEITESVYSYGTDELSLLPYGWYNIKLTRTGLDGNSESVVYRYPNVSADNMSSAWKAFTETDGSGFADVWETYADNIYYRDDYKEIFDNYSKLGDLYVKVRDSVYDTSSTDTFSMEEDAIRCCGYALSIYAIENMPKNDAKKITDKYNLPYSNLYDFDDFDALYEIFKKADINSGEFGQTIKKIYAYANLQDGSVKRTVKDAADSISKHSDILGINLSYAKNKNVSVNAVAAKMDFSNAFSYYSNSKWFENIVDKIVSDSSSGSSNNGSSGNRGSSSGSSGGYTPAPSVPTEKNDNNVNDGGFNDMGGYDWAKECVLRLYKKNIVTGMGDGKFSPAAEVKREEFVAMIVRAFDLTIVNGKEQEFFDVPEDSWCSEYIAIASSRGIVSGFGDGSFGVGNRITRQDMAVILLNVMKLKNLSIVPEKSGFSDRSDVSDYAGVAVDTLSQLKIINGFEDNTFMPQGYATRAETAVVIDRMFSYINGGN